MGLGQALSYIFEDRLWINKLAIVAILAFASLIPILGLVALAALLGYLVEIVTNVKRRVPGGLPVWSGMEKKIGDGAAVLAALFIYNLPNFLLAGCMLTAPRLFGDNVIATGSSAIVTFCCLTPMILIYTLTSWSMLAAGIVRFAESGKASEFYRFNTLFGDIQRNGGLTLQWVVFAAVLNVVLALFAATVCGIVAVLAFAIPVHGHLLGQYGQRVDFSPNVPSPSSAKPAPKRKPYVRR